MAPLYNAVWYLVPNVGYEKRPEIFKFGVTANYSVCQQFCDKEPDCYAFGYANDNAGTYSNTCFGRGFGKPEILVQQATYVMSGVKLC